MHTQMHHRCLSHIKPPQAQNRHLERPEEAEHPVLSDQPDPIAHTKLNERTDQVDDDIVPRMLGEGSQTPNFMAIDQTGLPVCLEDFRGQWVVLFFTPTCGLIRGWQETLGFNKLYHRFQALGVEVMGLSTDSLTHNHQMANLNRLSYLLLSDWEKKVFGSFGVLTPFGKPRRATFIIDPRGIVARVYTEVKVKVHPGQVLQDLDELIDDW